MTHSPLGRLPPLHAIGRSRHIDLEEPPPPPITEYDDMSQADIDDYFQNLMGNEFTSSSSRSQQPPPVAMYVFSVESAELANATLGDMYEVLEPGTHCCRRGLSFLQSSPRKTFSHCVKSAVVGASYRRLKALLEYRSRLELMKEVLSRIHLMSAYVANLRSMVLEECQTFHDICRNSLQSEPVSQLNALSSLGEDLRAHLCHWTAVKQCIHTNTHIRPLLSGLCGSLVCEAIRLKFLALTVEAISWMQRLIHVGFKVLAHCDLERLGQDVLWNISRGLEDFNVIVTTSNVQTPLSCVFHSKMSVANLESLPTATTGFEMYIPHISLANIASKHTKNISLLDVLHLVACERSKYAVVSTRDYFLGGREFERIVRRADVNGASIWTMKCKASTKQSVGDLMKQLSSLDLCGRPSPLIDFARRESTFVARFLHVICNSTRLITGYSAAGNAVRDSGNIGIIHGSQQDNHINSAVINNNYVHPRQRLMFSKKATMAVTHSSEYVNSAASNLFVPDTQEPEETLSNMSISGRKSVSWSDARLTVVVQETTRNYLGELWQNFTYRLFDALVGVDMQYGPKDSKDCVGSLVCCSDIILRTMDIMLHSAALAGMCAASAALDKFQPIQLPSGVYATPTTKLFQECYQPLHEVLANIFGDQRRSLQSLVAVSSSRVIPGGVVDADLSQLLIETIDRLVLTDHAAITWLSSTSLRLLSPQTFTSFLLISQSDLQIVLAEMRQTLTLINAEFLTVDETSECSVSHQSWPTIHINLQPLHESVTNLQLKSKFLLEKFYGLCSTLALEFLQEKMPTGKEWKRKSSDAVIPTRHFEYIEQAMEKCLEPVITGVNKLQPDVQYAALSAAITAFYKMWMSNILNQKIKFSYCGACQLELDVLYGRTWLDSYISEPHVRARALSLDVLTYMDLVVTLLQQQPHSGTGKTRVKQALKDKNRKSSGELSLSSDSDGTRSSAGNTRTGTPNCEMGADSQGNGVSSDKSHFQLGTRGGSISNGSFGFDDMRVGIGVEIDIDKLPQKEQWLSLRVNNGSRPWPKLSSCFNNVD